MLGQGLQTCRGIRAKRSSSHEHRHSIRSIIPKTQLHLSNVLVQSSEILNGSHNNILRRTLYILTFLRCEHQHMSDGPAYFAHAFN
jgi:hypothetical protein